MIDAPDRKATIALVEFDNGISIAARCVDSDFEVLLTGLPEAARRDTSRELRVSIGDELMGAETWSVGTVRSTAFSRVPAPFARRMVEGGRIQIGVPGTQGRPSTRYVMELTPSSEALSRTLTACGRPLVDPRDLLISRNASDGLAQSPQDGLPTLAWGTRPSAAYPEQNDSIAENGSVTLSCLVETDGSLDQCVVESEHPAKFGFAEAALKAARRARIVSTPTPGEGIEGRMILYSTNFILE